MRPRSPAVVAFLAAAALASAASPSAAQLTDLQPGRNFVSSAEFGTFRSEALALGDCDNDGDLDVLVGNGGDGGPQPNKLFINQGGLQAGTPGTFVDESALRFAGVPNDTSRDCEFVDIDDDGDLDVHISNRGTTASGGEPNRFYRNLGAAQGGTVGYYVEDTNLAYGTLVSVPLALQVFGGNQGPFRDFCHDVDFADLDDDGDLDMFHGTSGPQFNGTYDSRVFLNDGTGRFDELWPWADPLADTKMHLIDMDLADLDGDYDLDVITSSRDSQARVFVNNLYQPLGPTPFQDVTQSALLDTGAKLTGSNHYEVELADVDGDGDFDAWMVNYNGNFDRLLRNDAHGQAPLKFTQMNGWIVGDPNQDENEVDFGDYDGDGDLDLLAANFSGTNWIYQSGLAQGLDPGTQGLYHRTGANGTLAMAFPETPTTGNGGTSLDAAWGDLDGDGDLDGLIGNDGNQQNRAYFNALGVPDVHAPTLLRVSGPTAPAAGQPAVIHAQARDNAPIELFVFYDAVLVWSVDGGPDTTTSMFAQNGQQYRGVIPPQVGSVSWHVEVTDLAGNTGVSETNVYVQGAPDAWTDLGSGLAGAGGVPSLAGTGTLAPGSSGSLTLSGAAPTATALLFLSFSSTPTPFKGGTLVPVPVALTIPLVTDGAGSIPLAWASWPGGLPGGTTLYVQVAIADAGAPAGTALSNALLGVTP